MRNDIDVNYFKLRLEERLAAIVATQKNQKEDAAPVELDQTKCGRLTRMDALQQQAMSQATIRLANLELQRIQSALGRMQSGNYGYCLRCEEEIAKNRLRFDPSILTCISCANEANS